MSQGSSKLLIVEGKNDYHFLHHLVLVEPEIKIDHPPHGGNKTQALDNFISKISDSKHSVIGLILDADSFKDLDPQTGCKVKAAESTLDAIKDKFKKNNAIKIEEKTLCLDSCGIISHVTTHQGYQKIKIGVWIMPNNCDDGMLEDFILTAINNIAPCCVKYAEQCVERADAGCVSYKQNHRSKAVLHTYLAWQNEPDSPFGIASKQALKKAENSDVNLNNFVEWFFKLYGDVSS